MKKCKTLKPFSVSGYPSFKEGVIYNLPDGKFTELEQRGLVKILDEKPKPVIPKTTKPEQKKETKPEPKKETKPEPSKEEKKIDKKFKK